LIDIAIPIIIEGEHFGNLFTGQFLFEKPDTDFFRKQAHKFGFDEVSYLKALAKVPIIDEKDVKQYTDFLQDLTELLGEMGLNRIHDIEKKNDLQKSEKQLATLMSNLPGMVYRRKNDPHWTMEFISDGCQLLTGYRAEDLTGNALTS